jgi:transmembrane sensor
VSSDTNLQAEAADWVVRLDAGTARPDDFARWRDADPRHRIAFAQALADWEAMEQAHDADDATPPLRQTRFEGRGRRAFLRAAAVIGPVLAVGGGGALLFRDDRAHAATAVGEMRRFEAAPGLTIELNTDSRVSWKTRGRTSEVWLEQGEAALFIDRDVLDGATLRIAGDEILLAPGGYSARAVEAAPEVLVIDGGARVGRRGANATTVLIGQKVRLSEGRPVAPEHAPDIAAATAWRRGEIVFAGQTLGQAVTEYNRYLDRKLVVADPAVAAIRIGGRFDTVRPEAFLTALEQSFDLKARPTTSGVVIERKSTAG